MCYDAGKPIESVVYCFYKITLSKTMSLPGTINHRFFNQSEHAYYLSYFIIANTHVWGGGEGGVISPSRNLKNALRSHSNHTH